MVKKADNGAARREVVVMCVTPYRNVSLFPEALLPPNLQPAQAEKLRLELLGEAERIRLAGASDPPQ